MSRFQFASISHYSTRRTVVNTQGILSVIPSMSLIERWHDHMYSPDVLDVKQIETKKHHYILVQLPSAGNGKVDFELCGNRLIILITPLTDSQTRYEQEHYCEVVLPAHVATNRAVVEMSDHVLTVTFTKSKQALGEHNIASHTAEKAQGQKWNIPVQNVW